MIAPPKSPLRTSLVCLALLLLAGTALYLPMRPAQPPKAVIQFVGSTNSSTTYTTREGTFPVTIALFRITNSGNHPFFQWGVSSFDAKNGSGESGIDYGAPEFQGVLAPGQSKTVSIVAPWTVYGPWRAGFRFSRVDWRYRVSTWPPWVQTMLRSLVSEKRLIMNYEQQIFSDWVEIPRVGLAPPRIEPASVDIPSLTNPRPFTTAPRLDLAPARPPSSERPKLYD